MSYCVNCGVELEAAQKNCPLCGVPVINPMQKEDPHAQKAYPLQRDELKKKDRMFWIQFISALLAVPIITCVLSNLIFEQRLTWSLYVIAGVFILWVLSTSPLYLRKFSYRIMLLFDMAALIIGILVIEAVAPNPGWFIAITLPAVAYSFAALFIIIRLAQNNRLNGISIAAALFITAALMMPGLEALIDLYTSTSVILVWSWFVTAPCLSVALLLTMLNRNKRFKQALAKRLHF